MEFIHSTFAIQSNNAHGQITFGQFKAGFEAKQLSDQGVVFLFVAAMRAIGADVSLVHSYSANACSRIFWAELFVNNVWLRIDPLAKTIGLKVSYLNF